MTGFDKIPIAVQPRVNAAFAIVIAIFGVLLLRLWYLQILYGDYFRDRSENNRIRTVYVPPPRGLLLDRHGEVLVKNRPSFNIDLVREDSPNPEETVAQLSHILNVGIDELRERLEHQKKRRRFEPKLVAKDVPRDVVARVAAKRYYLPGIIVSVVPARDYIYGVFASHVLGYIREITKKQLEAPEYSDYRIGDLVGQFGIEARWESRLRGVAGRRAVTVNAAGQRIKEESFRPEESGYDVMLTLDRVMQMAADVGLRGKTGAIVALKVDTGEVLAMASSPGYDPNMFTGEIPLDEWRDLIAGREKRMSNRGVQGTYPPGSVFKIFMAIAGLSEGVVTPSTRVTCPGYYRFGRRSFRCHKRGGHGSVNLYEAMVQSCDVYFYILGERLGVDRIHDYATRFGLGQETGLRLVQEERGIIPSTEWKRKYFKRKEDKKWYPGETLSVAIGQGAVTTTPMQIARGVAALANGGKVFRPYLVKEVRSPDGRLRDDNFNPEVVSEADVEPWVLSEVQKALAGVVNDARGTGKRARLPEELGVRVAGKTGTAQVVALGKGQSKHFEDHAWFVGYAPADKPEVVAAAIVENGGHGGVAAAPLVRSVLEAYFDREKVLKEVQPLLSGSVELKDSVSG